MTTITRDMNAKWILATLAWPVCIAMAPMPADQALHMFMSLPGLCSVSCCLVCGMQSQISSLVTFLMHFSNPVVRIEEREETWTMIQHSYLPGKQIDREEPSADIPSVSRLPPTCPRKTSKRFPTTSAKSLQLEHWFPDCNHSVQRVTSL